MPRINVYDPEDGSLAGWFDPAKCRRYEQGTTWDGNSTVGVITRVPLVEEDLYRTPGGRWVLNRDGTRNCGGDDTYRFLTDDEALDWLRRSEINDEAIERYAGKIADEAGPGRPAIGGLVTVAVGERLLADIDAEAGARGVTRAALVRDLLAGALAARLNP